VLARHRLCLHGAADGRRANVQVHRPAALRQTVAYIGLGSNLGDRERTLRTAAARLGELGEVRLSTIRETDPVGVTDQPKFLNAVVRLETDLPARELLERLLAIEQAQGRDRRAEKRWGPRTLDLDLLLYGDEAIDEPGLTVPHPRMAERRFVLEPLHELAPELVFPDGRALRELLGTQVE
jgi:2-amino-4-hydroxy-6-hydroxymethyldihydropteridine diphosphokinase